MRRKPVRRRCLRLCLNVAYGPSIATYHGSAGFGYSTGPSTFPATGTILGYSGDWTSSITEAPLDPSAGPTLPFNIAVSGPTHYLASGYLSQQFLTVSGPQAPAPEPSSLPAMLLATAATPLIRAQWRRHHRRRPRLCATGAATGLAFAASGSSLLRMRSWIQCSSHHSTGIDLHAVDLHAEVHVDAAGQAGLAAPCPASGPSCHHVAHLDVDAAHVPVDRLQPVSVVQHHAVAVDPQVGGPHHPAVVGRMYRSVRRVATGRSPGAPAGPLSCPCKCSCARRRNGLFLAPVQERARSRGTSPRSSCAGRRAAGCSCAASRR